MFCSIAHSTNLTRVLLCIAAVVAIIHGNVATLAVVLVHHCVPAGVFILGYCTKSSWLEALDGYICRI
jgi:hypothetical protein